ncbi:MAG: hypothetical protein ACXQT6_04425 [Candidatus Methanospirareceae archaeon]
MTKADYWAVRQCPAKLSFGVMGVRVREVRATAGRRSVARASNALGLFAEECALRLAALAAGGLRVERASGVAELAVRGDVIDELLRVRKEIAASHLAGDREALRRYLIWTDDVVEGFSDKRFVDELSAYFEGFGTVVHRRRVGHPVRTAWAELRLFSQSSQSSPLVVEVKAWQPNGKGGVYTPSAFDRMISEARFMCHVADADCLLVMPRTREIFLVRAADVVSSGDEERWLRACVLAKYAAVRGYALMPDEIRREKCRRCGFRRFCEDLAFARKLRLSEVEGFEGTLPHLAGLELLEEHGGVVASDERAEFRRLWAEVEPKELLTAMADMQLIRGKAVDAERVRRGLEWWRFGRLVG